MRRKAKLAYSALGLALLVIGLPTISDGIAGWAVWLHWIGRGGPTGMPAAAPSETEAQQTLENEATAPHAERRGESDSVPGEISVADLPAPAAQAFAEMTRRRRIADLVAARVMKARELRAAFDEFIETFLTRRAQFVAGMTGVELERAREEYGRLQRGAARAYRAVHDDYRRFLQEEPQYNRSSVDPEDFVPEEPLPDWWQPLTFDAALERYANADDEHLRPYIAEERAILEAFAEWVSEPRHHELAGDLAGANLEDEEILGLVQRQLTEREQARQRATISARPGATSRREYVHEYNFEVMNSGPATALNVRVWLGRDDGILLTKAVEMHALPADNRWNPLRLEILRVLSEAGGLRLIVSWQDEAGEHEEALLEILPLR